MRGPLSASGRLGNQGPREGSKTAQVVTILQRKNGVTLDKIMKTKEGSPRKDVQGRIANLD